MNWFLGWLFMVVLILLFMKGASIGSNQEHLDE